MFVCGIGGLEFIIKNKGNCSYLYFSYWVYLKIRLMLIIIYILVLLNIY